jgi:SulP family sulfate permease
MSIATQAVVQLRGLLPRKGDLVAMVRTPRKDLVAGLTVAVVALPLALAFGISSGMGAAAGLITAVIAGALAAFFGGSRVQVSGPTGAMTVVLVPIVAEYGAGGVLVVGMAAGLILVTLAAVGAGGWMRYVPLPVVEGFTIGIALVIGLQQLPAILGVESEGERILVVDYHAVVAWLEQPHFVSLVLALAVAGLILVMSRVRPGVPMSLAAVILAAAATAVLDLDAARIGAIPSSIPMPGFPDIVWLDLPDLLLPAFAVAALAALESLLSASVADGMSDGERHDPDRELFGQGVANLVVPLFGGVPATAAIARTAVNVRTGAQSRMAAVVQSAVILVVILGASRWVADIPIAALAGVLIATSVQMIEVSSLRALMRGSRGDFLVLIATMLTTLALDLVTAVIVGLMAAGFLALRQMSLAARLDTIPIDNRDYLVEEDTDFDHHIVVYSFEGALFFGAAHSFLLEVAEVSDVRVVVLRMSRLVALDSTGAAVLADTIKRLENRGITVILAGLRPEHATRLDHLGVYGSLAHEKHVFHSLHDAITHARIHAARAEHHGS